MKFAIVRCGGKQYRVSPGDVVKIERQAAKDGKLELGEVLALCDDEGLKPPPAGTRVEATVVSEGKARKVLVFHYKRKKQYKKLMGHRQQFIAVRVDAIQVGS